MPHAAGMQQQHSSATFGHDKGVVAVGQDVALSVEPGQVPQTQVPMVQPHPGLPILAAIG